MTLRSAALGTALVLLGPIAARATPLVQTISGLSQTLGDTVPYDIAFLPYDGSFGPLQSVTLELAGGFIPKLFSDNRGNVSTVSLTTRLSVYATNDTAALQSVVLPTEFNVTGVQGVSSTSFTGPGALTDQFFTFTNVAVFLGNSAVPVNLIEYGFRTAAAPALVGTGSDATTFTGVARITYNVPEPATAATFAAALLGLGWMRRRHS